MCHDLGICLYVTKGRIVLGGCLSYLGQKFELVDDGQGVRSFSFFNDFCLSLDQYDCFQCLFDRNKRVNRLVENPMSWVGSR